MTSLMDAKFFSFFFSNTLRIYLTVIKGDFYYADGITFNIFYLFPKNYYSNFCEDKSHEL